MTSPNLDVGLGAWSLCDICQDAPDRWEVVRMNELGGGPANPDLRLMSEHPLDARAFLANGLIGADDQDHIRGVAHQRAKALLIVAKVRGQDRLALGAFSELAILALQ